MQAPVRVLRASGQISRGPVAATRYDKAVHKPVRHPFAVARAPAYGDSAGTEVTDSENARTGTRGATCTWRTYGAIRIFGAEHDRSAGGMAESGTESGQSEDALRQASSTTDLADARTDAPADGRAETAAQDPPTSNERLRAQLTRDRLLTDADALVPYLRGRLAANSAQDPLLHSQPQARAAAVLAPLYAVDGRPHLLFTRRTAHLRSHSGEISFPGGGYDLSDSSLETTALREAQEELALDPARIEVLGALPRVFTVVSNYLVLPIVGWLGAGLPALVPNAYEVAEVIEAPLAALANPAIFHEELWTRHGLARPVRFYDLGPYRIWGMTAHVVHTLLSLLPGAEAAHPPTP